MSECADTSRDNVRRNRTTALLAGAALLAPLGQLAASGLAPAVSGGVGREAAGDAIRPRPRGRALA